MALKFSDIFNTSDININNPKLEEVFNKTKDMAEAVSKKSAEHIEISRKKIECIDAKAKLAKLFEKYGQLQYNIYIGESVNPDELESLVSRISGIKEKIDSLSKEIEIAKSQFNEAVSNATKKTKDVFQREFDKMNNTDADVSAQIDNQVDVTEFFEQEE